MNTNFDPDLYAKEQKLQLYYYEEQTWAGGNYNTSVARTEVKSNILNSFGDNFFWASAAKLVETA